MSRRPLTKSQQTRSWQAFDDPSNGRKFHALVQDGKRIAVLVWHGGFVERPDFWMAIFADKRPSELYSDVLSEAKACVEAELMIVRQ